MPNPTLLTFKSGLPGLPEEYNQFNLKTVQENSPFYILQSVQDEEISFILINPFPFYPDYEFDLPEEDKTKLSIKEPKDVAIFSIVNASKGFKKATVNLLAPVVVNITTGSARQVILNDKRYNIRHPLPLTTESREG
ncbi:flagellar assembly protein FliW [Peptococcaceae bacterium 1198_IL3148]